MTVLQKQFKILSLALALVGIVGVVAGVLAMAVPDVSGAFFASLDGDAPGTVTGVVAIVAGACCVVSGLAGALAANRPRDVGNARVASVVAAVASVASVVTAALSSAVAWVAVLGVVLGLLVLAWASRANAEALDR